MAGIGFDLRRALGRRTGLLSSLRSYSTAGLISAGPWIMTIVALASLDLASGTFASVPEYELFRGLVTYAFCFSLIVVGGLQMAVTRHVADLLYGGDHDAVLPAFNVCVGAVGVLQAILGTAFCVLADLAPAVTIAAVGLYVVVSLQWLALVWLTVTREHDDILRAYLLGMAVTLGAIPLLTGADAATLLFFYAIGQALTLALLIRSVIRGLARPGPRRSDALLAVRRYPSIFLVGTAYSIAIWADKIVMWLADGGGPHPWVQFHALYDSSCFLAYLTAIPAMAVNLVRVETVFYERYRAYYAAVVGGEPLAAIEQLRREMIGVLGYGARRIMRVQGALSIAVIVFAEPLLAAVGMDPAAVPIFRAACLGAYFHVMLLITLLMQLYFDLRREAVITTFTFLGLNVLLSMWSVHAGPTTYGLGYAVAALLSLALASTLLRSRLSELEYLTFVRQPFPEPSF